MAEILFMQITASIPPSIRTVLSKGNQCFLLTNRLGWTVCRYFMDFFSDNLLFLIGCWKLEDLDTLYLFMAILVQYCRHFSSSKSELCWWCISGFKTTGLPHTAESYCKYSGFNFYLFNFLRIGLELDSQRQFS